MSRLSCFIFGLLVGGGVVFGSQRYHVLKTPDGFEVVPKLSATFSETYVDISGFSAADWADHKGLAAAIFHAGKGDLIHESAVGSLRQKVDHFFSELNTLGRDSTSQ